MTNPQLRKASVRDSLAFLAEVLVPNVAKGLVIRRPTAVWMADRLSLDRRAVRRVQRLDDRYGPGPLQLNLPFRHSAVILDGTHAHRVLDETPEPYATETKEKRAALAHLEPRGALISSGQPRAERRRYNEIVLESENPMHSVADRFSMVVREETDRLLADATDGVLDWDRFAISWQAAVRRVVFGDGARDDDELTDMLGKLRSDANWAFAKPRDDRVRGRFFARMRHHLERAEPGSLAAVMASARETPLAEPEHQVPQWLFAFDPAGMATIRALALLAAHPDHAGRAREDAAASGAGPSVLRHLRATILESLRLWPTTPLIMRETTRPVTWDGGSLPEATGVIIFALYFHRDDRRLPFADRFAPEVWMRDEQPAAPLVPFSAGPGICPGRHLVLLTGSAFLARVLATHDVRQLPPRRLRADRPMPATLDHHRLRFALRERG